LSQTYEGKRHDKKIADEEAPTYPKDISLYQETGFQGYTPASVQTFQPQKKPVVFQKWRWPCLHRPSEGIAVDKQANDDVVHLRRFEKQIVLRTRRLIRVRNVRCLRSIFLRVAFAWAMDVGVQMPGVGAPIIGVVAGEPEGLQQRFAL